MEKIYILFDGNIYYQCSESEVISEMCLKGAEIYTSYTINSNQDLIEINEILHNLNEC